MIRACLLIASVLLVSCDAAKEDVRTNEPLSTLRLAYVVEPVEPYAALRADVIEFTGQNGDVGTVENFSLPWRVSFPISRDLDQVYELEAVLSEGGDRAGMRARITIDGETVSQQGVAGTPGGFRMPRVVRASYRQRPE